jgi:peptidoglycan/LPS O-acetylase OafA/YrhL
MSVMSSLLFACLTVFISYKLSIKSKVLSFLGDISYEFYIFQLPIIHIVLHNITAKIDYLYSFIVVIVTIALAFCAHKISDFICQKIAGQSILHIHIRHV